MSLIQGGRWQGYLRRMFTLKDLAPQTISDELLGTVSVVPPRPEDVFLLGDRLYHVNQTSTSAAANFGHVNIRNESDNQLVIVESIFCYAAAPGDFQLRMGNNPVGTGPITISARDTRLGIQLVGGQQAGGVRFGHELVAAGGIVQRLELPANTKACFETPIVLGPGGVVFCWINTANQTHNVSIAWRERFFEPGEIYR